MKLLERIENAKKLWNILLPHVQAPEDRTFGIWCTEFDTKIMEHAFARAGSKFRNHRGNPELAYRYASGVMTSELRSVATIVGNDGVKSDETGSHAQ